ncbi:MAG: HAD hydrolase-like protein, partial [Lacunisphaera sp.]|nr:HAD hydrolase-like protein [Lacunisphaera sp.]
SLFPCTAPFLATLQRLGLGFTFFTNNSSRSRADYVAKLRAFGLPADLRRVLVSTDAAVTGLRRQWPAARRIFALGTPSFLADIAAAGFTLLPDSPAEPPDAVLVAYDPSVTYARLCRAAWWIRSGLPYVATNPDYTCPTDEPTVLVDCGSLCAALHAATGRWPDLVAGKPHLLMMQTLFAREDLSAGETAMVGDRLMTDATMARASGALGVVVLSGEATVDDVASFAPPPDLVVSDVGELGNLLLAVRRASPLAP